jgi:starch synthase (maltosyl-transferring)
VKDLLTGKVYDWSQDNYVRLDSFTEPAHIFEVIR